MRILIQDRKTHLFFQDLGKWIAEKEQARDFPNALSALQFSMENDLGDVEIIFEHKRRRENLHRSEALLSRHMAF